VGCVELSDDSCLRQGPERRSRYPLMPD
jgi:hypothetical protein